MTVQAEGDDAKAVTLFEKSLELYSKLYDDERIVWSLYHLGTGALTLADYEQAPSLFAQSIAIFRRLADPDARLREAATATATLPALAVRSGCA